MRIQTIYKNRVWTAAARKAARPVPGTNLGLVGPVAPLKKGWDESPTDPKLSQLLSLGTHDSTRTYSSLLKPCSEAKARGSWLGGKGQRTHDGCGKLTFSASERRSTPSRHHLLPVFLIECFGSVKNQ